MQQRQPRIEHIQCRAPGPVLRLYYGTNGLDDRCVKSLATGMSTVVNQAMRSWYWEVRAARAIGTWEVIDTCYQILSERWPEYCFDLLSSEAGVHVYGWKQEK